MMRVSPENPAAGLENAPTVGGVIGGTTGVPPLPSTAAGGVSPPAMGQSQPAEAPQSGCRRGAILNGRSCQTRPRWRFDNLRKAATVRHRGP